MKDRIVFVCESCGASFPKWMGRCTSCNEWSSLVESVEREKKKPPARTPHDAAVSYAEVDVSPTDRLQTGLPEVDRLLGGGLVPGSLVLIGGDPGIGKSTLVLQLADGLQRAGRRVLYVSGEESAAQVKLRGQRLDVAGQALFLLAERDLDGIEAEIVRLDPNVLIVDSIQTVHDPAMMSTPGSVAQVRGATTRLLASAKSRGMACFIIGHITKEGAIAGPKSLEHMVDTVMYFEGDRQHANRVLRVQKNRFGSVSEIALFTMDETGLRPVPNPSTALLKERPAGASGSVVTCCVQGSQPLLVEVQALVSSGFPGNPRRMTTGVDHSRVAMLLAVLEKRVSCQLASEDVFVNVPGGLYLDDPGIDLAVVAAVWSSVRRRPVRASTVVFGEVGLAGEVRAVTACARRVAEASAHGYQRILLPAGNVDGLGTIKGAELLGSAFVKQALENLLETRNEP
ncbi:MAG: DNA repair protein RadA [Acidobacteriota bacterium]